jgi:predicted tellurium resistance membrane protein TerC
MLHHVSCSLTAYSATLAAAGATDAITKLWSIDALVAMVTLTLLEIVLGIDNIIFISVLADKLPAHRQARARTLGLTLAMVLRVLLLLSINWIMSLTTPLPLIGHHLTWTIGDDKPLNWRDVILLLGGLFLIYKSVSEIHEKLEGPDHPQAGAAGPAISFTSVIVQILILDIVFSLDSVITAIGMVQTAPEHRSKGLSIMIAAVVIAVGVMLVAAKPIADFVNRHPTVKILAFAFLVLVGVVLIADSTHRHVPKGYIYFAMAFSVCVEMLNLRLRKKGTPVHLHESIASSPPTLRADA